MSKIVILMGSPRQNGNTATLAKAFSDGAIESGNQVETVSVCKYKINPCVGCNYCYTSENNACCQQDDMQKIYDILASCDVLCIASPVYFYGVSSQLKTLIDRLHSPMRKNFKLKKLALLCVCADKIPQVFDSIVCQYNLTLNYFKLADAGKVLVRSVAKVGDIAGNPLLKDAFELGKSI